MLPPHTGMKRRPFYPIPRSMNYPQAGRYTILSGKHGRWRDGTHGPHDGSCRGARCRVSRATDGGCPCGRSILTASAHHLTPRPPQGPSATTVGMPHGVGSHLPRQARDRRRKRAPPASLASQRRGPGPHDEDPAWAHVAAWRGSVCMPWVRTRHDTRSPEQHGRQEKRKGT